MMQTAAAKPVLGKYYREPKKSGPIPLHLLNYLVRSIKQDHYVSDTGDVLFYQTDAQLYGSSQKKMEWRLLESEDNTGNISCICYYWHPANNIDLKFFSEKCRECCVGRSAVILNGNPHSTRMNSIRRYRIPTLFYKSFVLMPHPYDCSLLPQ